MRLSHKKKLAHKRSGAAKGWALVLRSRPSSSRLFMMSVSINGERIDAGALDAASRRVMRSAEHPARLMTKLVGVVASTFRRLREAGAAQADIIRGRIG